MSFDPVEKFNNIQDEILRIGWEGILKKYHPDVNFKDKNAFQIFQMYKHIYEDMRKRMIVKEGEAY